MEPTNQWAAILAGGDGVRLQSLTSSLAGDRRPKQYCRLLGNRTLIDETRQRLASVVPSEQTLFVVTEPHERYYSEELADVPSSNVLAQPINRGTMAAVLLTLARMRSAKAEGILGFFPSDHHYRDSKVFCNAIAMAYWQAERRPDRVILIGAHATRAETDYGWIQPGAVLARQQYASGCHWPLRTVECFVEKPTGAVAQNLLSRGCLWNTMVVIGHTVALTALILGANRLNGDGLAALTEATDHGSHRDDLLRVYQNLSRADFSADALATAPDRLLVMGVPDLGWTDLGRPERVADVLAERHQVLTGNQMVG